MGAVNVLVGENGAGKSTLMKVTAGVETLTDGQIIVDGVPVQVRAKDDAVKPGIGIVFQELNLVSNCPLPKIPLPSASRPGSGFT